jgi:hypothetical protein
MKITHHAAAPPEITMLELGDIVVIHGSPPRLYLVIHDWSHEQFGFIDLLTNEGTIEFQDLSRVLKWMKSNHKDFTVIRKDQIELILNHS